MIHPIIPPINIQYIPTPYTTIFIIDWLFVKRFIITTNARINNTAISKPPITPNIAASTYTIICIIKS